MTYGPARGGSWLLRRCLVVVVSLCCTTAADPIVESLTPILEHGDAPAWSPIKDSVYFVDVPANAICRYNTETKRFFRVKIEESTVQLPFVASGQPNFEEFVVCMEINVGFYNWDGVANTSMPSQTAPVNIVQPPGLITAGKVDSRGRLWVASCVAQAGSLSTVETDGKVTERRSDLPGCPRAMTWSTDDKVFYYADADKSTIMAHDYNINTGDVVGEARVVFNFTATNVTGKPSGMTVDHRHNLVVACSETSNILQIDPVAGTVLMTVELPGASVTSVTFGSRTIDELYVTTAKTTQFPDSGALLRVTNTGLVGFNIETPYLLYSLHP